MMGKSMILCIVVHTVSLLCRPGREVLLRRGIRRIWCQKV